MGFASLQQPTTVYQPVNSGYQAPVTPAGPSGAVFNNNGYNWNLPAVSGYKPPPAPVAPVRPAEIKQENQGWNWGDYNPFGEFGSSRDESGYLDDGTYVGADAAAKYKADLGAYNEAKKSWDEGTPTIALNPRGYVDPNVRGVQMDPRAGQIYQPTSSDTSTYNWGIPGTQSDPSAFAPKEQAPAEYGTEMTSKDGSIVPQFNVDQFITKMLSPQMQAATQGSSERDVRPIARGIGYQAPAGIPANPYSGATNGSTSLAQAGKALTQLGNFFS